MKAVAEYLDEIGFEDDFGQDIHRDNIMLRGKQPVIVDGLI